MTGKTHLLVPAALMLVISSKMAVPTETAIAGITMAGIGGLLPDIDHKHSTISKKMVITSFLARSVSGHRGIFHTPLFWGLIGVLLWFFLPQNVFDVYAAPALFGCATHLALDSLNPTGVPIFWPISQKKIHLAKIRTGGKFDHLIGVVTAAVAMVVAK